ncbi:MAG TPA: hypothetical protein VKV15_26390, partial [Bryobacteraceae bacterium]|nr:hypothetical protein [Bryobacteraceae bacterium]
MEMLSKDDLIELQRKLRTMSLTGLRDFLFRGPLALPVVGGEDPRRPIDTGACASVEGAAQDRPH